MKANVIFSKLIHYQYLSFRRWSEPSVSKLRVVIALGALLNCISVFFIDLLLIKITGKDVSCFFGNYFSIIFCAIWFIWAFFLYRTGEHYFSDAPMLSEDSRQAQWLQLGLFTFTLLTFYLQYKIGLHCNLTIK